MIWSFCFFHPSWTDFSVIFQTASNTLCVYMVISKMQRMLGVSIPLCLELFGLAQPLAVDIVISLICRCQFYAPASLCALSALWTHSNWSYQEPFLNTEKIGMQKKASPSWDILELDILKLTFSIFRTSWHIMATFSIIVWHWWGKHNKFISLASQLCIWIKQIFKYFTLTGLTVPKVIQGELNL